MKTIEIEAIFCFNFYRQIAKGRLKNFRRRIKHYLSLK